MATSINKNKKIVNNGLDEKKENEKKKNNS